MANIDTVSTTLKKDVAQFKKLDQNRKFILFVFLGGLFLLSVIIGSRVGKRQSPQPAMTPEEAAAPTLPPAKPSTTLMLAPSSKTFKVGFEEVLSVSLSKLPVAASDIVLTYDPAVLAVSGIKNGAVFAKVIRQKADKGVITFSASVDPADKNNLKEGVVFTFKVKPLTQSDSTVINFDPIKTITALEGDNVLGSTVGGMYTVAK